MRTLVLAEILAAGVLLGGEAHWRSLPIRSQAEFEQGLPGGESEQFLHDLTRSVSRPDRLYLGHDMGGVWRSDDNGHSWQHTLCHGLAVVMIQSIEVDPVNADVVMVIAGSGYDYQLDGLHGLYRSEDAGLHWRRVLTLPGTRDLPGVPHRRQIQRNLTWDPATVGAAEARVWYAAINGRHLYRSTDGGRTWTPVAPLEAYGRLDGVIAAPAPAGSLYLCTEKGLFRSSDDGASWVTWGNLPTGRVRSLDLDPARPEEMLATVDDRGVYRSTDGGATFSLLFAFEARRVRVHPTHRDVIYVLGARGAHMRVSHDAGATWHAPTVDNLPGWERDDNWKRQINGDLALLLPDPRNPRRALVQGNATLYRTEDGGQTFRDSSAGFTGYSWGWYTCGMAFDAGDPLRFALFMKDVGAVFTDTGGDWFVRRRVPWEWVRDRLIPHSGVHGGDIQPLPGSQVVVASAGIYWREALVRTATAGREWELVNPTLAQNLLVAFHRQDPAVVYAHNQRSDNAGKTFHVLAGLPADAVLVGVAPGRSDTVYAMDRARTELWRSDDRGETWRSYAKPGWKFNRLDGKPTFRVCPEDPSRVYTLDADGDLACFDGTTWKTLPVLRLAGAPPEVPNFVRTVAIDPRQPRLLYAGTKANGYSHAFRSTDGGARWEDITGNLPRLGLGGLAVHPHTGDVFVCVDGTGTRVLAPPYDSPTAIYHRLAPR